MFKLIKQCKSSIVELTIRLYILDYRSKSISLEIHWLHIVIPKHASITPEACIKLFGKCYTFVQLISSTVFF